MKHTEERQTCHIFLYCRLRCSSNVEALLASRSHFHILGWAVPKYLHKWFIFQKSLALLQGCLQKLPRKSNRDAIMAKTRPKQSTS